MVTAPQVPGKVEEIEEVEEVTRGRGAAPKRNYKKKFTDLNEAKSNPPASEDGDTVEGYRLYKIGNFGASAIWKVEGKELEGVLGYVWGRSQDQAKAFWADDVFDCDSFERKTRGATIDPVYLKFIDFMLSAKQFDDLKAVLEEKPQYNQYIADNANKTDNTPDLVRFAKQVDYQAFMKANPVNVPAPAKA